MTELEEFKIYAEKQLEVSIKNAVDYWRNGLLKLAEQEWASATHWKSVVTAIDGYTRDCRAT